MLRNVLTSLCLLALIGCSDPQHLNAGEFRSLFEASGKDSAVSWWYHGQDDRFYYVSQKYPLKETAFKVSKKGVEIRGMPESRSKYVGEPRVLKAKDVVFTNNAL